MIYLYLAIAFLVGYFIGNVNFARIFSLAFAKKDITTVGSKNPGTMNMLRTRGLKEAVLTLVFEAVKAGGPSLAGYFLFEHFYAGYGNLAFFIIGFGAVLGHCFPVFYKFKGGKGVACTFGMFLFHPDFWWMSLILFAIGVVMIFFIEYPFLVTMSFVFAISIYSTCFFALTKTLWYIPLIVLIWVNCLLLVFMHRGNIKRLINGCENKVNFKEKVFKKKHKKEKSLEENKDNSSKEDPNEELFKENYEIESKMTLESENETEGKK